MAKNHYVSQLIIKRFAPSVSTFDMQTNQIVEHRQAAKIFFDRDIYDNDIEEKMAHDLEQPFASILDKKILNCEKIRLTRNELYLVKQFLLMDSVRTYTPEHFQRVITNFKSNTQGNERNVREHTLYPRGRLGADRADGASYACGVP